MSSGTTVQSKPLKSKELSEEARYIQQKEQTQLAAIRQQMDAKQSSQEVQTQERDFEGGFGGQENLEDRYATTSGEH